MNTIPADLVSEEEAATILQIGRTTLANWRWRAQGPRYFKFQRMIRYSKADLAEYVQRCAVQHAPTPPPAPEDFDQLCRSPS